jgi:hypothetical protein
MSEAVERLKEIGAQRVYEDTHIPAEHVQAILYESFEGLSKLQFLGFVSIMEREYGYDLSELRTKGIAYFDEKESQAAPKINENIFRAPPPKKSYAALYIFLALFVLGLAIFYTVQSSKSDGKDLLKESEVTTEIVEEPTVVQKSIVTEQEHLDTNETNATSQDKNESIVTETKEQVATPLQTTPKAEEKAVPKSFVIAPKSRVWMGYIDVATNKKYQKTIKKHFKLNPEKEWLLYFGHANVKVYIDGKAEDFSGRKSLRLHYKDAEITPITAKEFQRLNRGNKW